MNFKGIIKSKRVGNYGKNFAEHNGMWKGDSVGYVGLHLWIRKKIKKPDFCFDCKIKKPIDLHNIDNNYTRNLDTWVFLCRKCHCKRHRNSANSEATILNSRLF